MRSTVGPLTYARLAAGRERVSRAFPHPRHRPRHHVIRFENVSSTYAGHTKPALVDVTADIDKGEFVFLVGESGSGKSTFLRLVLRETRATQGHVFVADKELNKLRSWKVPALRRQIGTVFQDFRLLPEQDGLPERRLRAPGDRQAALPHQPGGPRDARAGRPRRQGPPDARRALRRRAAARRDRARVRQPAEDPDRRRAHRQPRPQHQRRHHEAARPDQPHRHHRRDGHPRRRHRRPDAQARHRARRRPRRTRPGRAASTATSTERSYFPHAAAVRLLRDRHRTATQRLDVHRADRDDLRLAHPRRAWACC